MSQSERERFTTAMAGKAEMDWSETAQEFTSTITQRMWESFQAASKAEAPTPLLAEAALSDLAKLIARIRADAMPNGFGDLSRQCCESLPALEQAYSVLSASNALLEMARPFAKAFERTRSINDCSSDSETAPGMQAFLDNNTCTPGGTTTGEWRKLADACGALTKSTISQPNN
ncbi:hypothetical protein [Marinobacter sp. ELB17]|uniref:hypothetical protein n=1 Tax=Marinobacter sp. ELB17 TaxID=270374 RepID=UPI0000F39C72|nr:hypothetical protein [Marinobacter sp. ELB17]EAZ97237.1 hypothetical protein MELB17_10108 [Marinobacter sp. ELB17]